MKEVMLMSNKRRDNNSVETENSTGFAFFCVRYLTYLLQALLRSPTSIKMSSNKHKEQHLDARKRVRFEIDMAMVVTVGTYHFKWTQNLKRKLDSWQLSTSVAAMPEQQATIILLEWHHVPSSVNYLSIEMRRWEKKSRKLRKREMEKGGDREEVRQCIDLLRELVPMGDEEYSMEELMEEVASYVRSLQFQVGALRSLLSMSSTSTCASASPSDSDIRDQ